MQNNNQKYLCLKNKSNDLFSFYFKDSNNENFEYLIKNNYQYIKYSKPKQYETNNQDENKSNFNDIKDFFNDKNSKFHKVEFKLQSFPEFKENIFNLISDFIDNKPNDSSYSEALKKIIKLFDKWKSSKKFEKLLGDFGEALFFERCIDLGIKNIKKDEEERFDFIINKNIFEIKTTIKDDPKIKITNKQITDNTNVVVIKITNTNCDLYNSQNGIINILDIYESIEQKQGELPKIFKDNKYYYTLDKDLTNSLIVDKKDTYFNLYKQEYLPKIDFKLIENNSKIKEIIFVLDATSEEISDNNFNNQLKELINL